MSLRPAAPAAVVALFALTLVGCQPTAPPAPEQPPAAETPTPTPEAEPLPEDTLLAISATATAENGAAVELTQLVHRSLAWDDPAAASSADLMSQVCDGSLDTSVYDEQLWSFTRVDVAATPVAVTPAWPADLAFRLFPQPGNDAVAADGAVVDDEDVDIATPFCVREKRLPGTGEGVIVLGIAGDTDEVSAAGNFTRWANTSYGFGTTEVQSQSAADTGITLSDCSYTVTDLGLELNGDNESWLLTDNDTTCTVGTPFTGAE